MAGTIRKIVACGMLIMGIVLTGLAYREHQPFAEARVKQEALVQMAVAELEKGSEDPLDRQIDFESLQRLNPDIIGWIYAPQIDVDQPILKGSSDTEYLNRDFEGNYSPLGSIFTWAHAEERLSDAHLCLFGHNMISGQMFGRLDAFTEESFRKENSKLYLYTPDRAKELEVESVYTCQNQDAIFQDDWKTESEQQMVTLATCTGYSSTTDRLVVNCKVAKEKLVL